jgi:hypothetical protein
MADLIQSASECTFMTRSRHSARFLGGLPIARDVD